MDSADRCLLVFAKPARPGLVKTRLLGELSARQAAELHGAFLGDLLDRLRQGRFSLRIAWALGPDESLPAGRIDAVRQQGRDLGERLFNALATAAREFRWVAAVGSDHPDLPLSLVNEAFDKLARGADAILGPAEDGGYYLVGVSRRGLRREIFRQMEWSTSSVLETTLRRCRQLGLRVERLPWAFDVDTPADLRRLVARLARRPELDCPRTRRLLTAWGRLPPIGAEGDSDEDP